MEERNRRKRDMIVHSGLKRGGEGGLSPSAKNPFSLDQNRIFDPKSIGYRQ